MLTYKSSDKNAKQLVNKLRLISEEQANTHTDIQLQATKVLTPDQPQVLRQPFSAVI